MRPKDLKTRIFLDSGDPEETKKIIKLLGFLDGQTTNPSLILKNPKAKKRIEQGDKFSKQEIKDFYKKVIRQISKLLPKGSVSIEVYADLNTTSDQMMEEVRDMSLWIPNAHIKLPTIKEGLIAAHKAVGKGINVNMTLCFNQQQALAVYEATKGARKGSVFISPFIGRLDDIGLDGITLIKNIMRAYTNKKDNKVEVLAASIRSLDHFLSVLNLGCDIVTAPYSVLVEWSEKGMPLPKKIIERKNGLKKIPFETKLNSDWKNFKILDDLTRKGVEKFCSDWNELIA
jgi:transaldolase